GFFYCIRIRMEIAILDKMVNVFKKGADNNSGAASCAPTTILKTQAESREVKSDTTGYRNA
ncbi:hypothetical protein HK096_000345, partial [Nowakowskiella sp. JEL0078]